MKKYIKKILNKLGYKIEKILTNQKDIDIKANSDIDVNIKESNTKEITTELSDKEINDITNSIIRVEQGKYDIHEIIKKDKRWGWVQCKVGLKDFFMFLGGNDDGVALKFLWNGVYEKRTMELWSSLSSSAKIILDIGAHTGSYTLAAKKHNKSAQIISFEPNFLNFTRLNLNLRSNGIQTTNSYMLAVGSKSEQVIFSVLNNNDYHSSGGSIGNEEGNNHYPVAAVSIDEFMKKSTWGDIDLIKIDTEGFEDQCIKGMKQVIRKSKPTIFFECILDSIGKNVQELLESEGYSFYVIDDDLGTIEAVKTISAIQKSPSVIDMSKLNRIAVHSVNKKLFLEKIEK